LLHVTACRAAPRPARRDDADVPTGGVLATGFANASNTAGKAVVRGTTNANAVIRPARR